MTITKNYTAQLRRNEGQLRCLKFTKWRLQDIVAEMLDKRFAKVSPNNTLIANQILEIELVIGAKLIKTGNFSNQSHRFLAKHRWDALVHSIGFDYLTESRLNFFYKPSNLNNFSDLNSSASVFGSLLSTSLRANWRNGFLALLTKERNVRAFDLVNPLSDKAVKFVSTFLYHQTVLPLGMLSPPALHHSYPTYMNLAGFGLALAKSFGGIAFDEEVVRNLLYSKHMSTQLSVCLTDQYMKMHSNNAWWNFTDSQRTLLSLDNQLRQRLHEYVLDVLAVQHIAYGLELVPRLFSDARMPVQSRRL
ncbi:hypothetical protein BOX15_Mlig008916g1 [Macrostomum lignano]|uniref:Uncharacterized protein n=1 Tax=Macrostomum lignano TaxID=282301 RepID=A0A267EZC0_9PLAT|nr:hypothetical protein BOX15_Mlig008916g2 [Macrostomum lignano]PAA68717.1 hypothetical protein BOX15_Mlig008916g1 [Macrostomum lignano]